MKRPPDFVIGDPANPYLLRWWIIPRNRWFNIYLHKMLRDDDDRALHDHPWWNVSIVLKGGFYEHMMLFPTAPENHAWAREVTYFRHREPGAIVLRRPTHAHRLELPKDGIGYSRSLFITGPRVREWGFWCPQGWKHWKLFTKADAPGEVGPGCGE